MIAGLPPGLTVSEDDDRVHPVTSDDPNWIETVWFPFFAGDTTVHARVVLRPNLGDQIVTVQCWRGAGSLLARHTGHWPLEILPDLRDAAWPNGFQLRCVEPLHRYQLAYRCDDTTFEVTFEAVMEPNPVSPDESPGMFLGHLEQAGRVRGRLELGGREHAIDCGTVRDRSWGPREIRGATRLGNAFGTANDSFAFFAYVRPDEAVERITGGFLLLDGTAATVVGGRRETTWDGDVPGAVQLELADALGRRCALSGTCRNSMLVDAGNGVYAVINLVEWGSERQPPATGENHDVWSRDHWIAAGRSPL